MLIATKFLNTNALVYTPANYDSSQSYPVLIFHPGAGEMGPGHTDINLLKVHGPFQFINGTTDLGLDLIIIAIQPADANPRPNVMQNYINAIKASYKISSIVVTGLSRGGMSWEWFALNKESQMSQLKGMVIFSGQGAPTNDIGFPVSNPYPYSWFIKYNIPLWLGAGTADFTYALQKSLYTGVNNLAGSNATWTEWLGAGHGDPVWSDAFNPAWKNNTLNKSIYKWAVDISAPVVIIPNQPPTVDAGSDQILEFNSSAILTGSASDGDGAITNILWEGPAGVTIINSNQLSAVALNLQTGAYIFKLTATDNKGATTSDTVTVTIQPNTSVPDSTIKVVKIITTAFLSDGTSKEIDLTF